jgi:hypothetical protein
MNEKRQKGKARLYREGSSAGPDTPPLAGRFAA